ncbi:putative F-box/LRR-repeat protein 9 [Salvia hispanica]|uniref:putative F-box/LRR-repeat protein 9 n=1 Tax=Salvia hispanica TaxID=49212 RepID=UPI0020097B7C|nr:putative F-box/LRR-repeat protein 9 [Salvia hispanica]
MQLKSAWHAKPSRSVPLPLSKLNLRFPRPRRRSPPWIELPDELTANILQRLSAEEILETAQEVCTTWWRISKTLPTWRVLELDIDRYGGNDFEMFYTCAINRSQGELTDLNRTYCTKYEDMLDYVVERSSKLLRLKIAEFPGK